MHVAEILSKSNKTLFSFEILPPLKGGSFNDIYKSIEPCLNLNPPILM
jgi:methylenetetrahydrofolate reductase (NADPH)